jgi:hypothetical protein
MWSYTSTPLYIHGMLQIQRQLTFNSS